MKITNSKGMSLIELVLVMGIIAALMGLVGISISTPFQKDDLILTTSNTVATLEESRSRAMSSDTSNGGVAKRFGVRFETDRYIIFGGSTYNANDSTNFVVTLPANFTFSTINVPSNQVVFEILSGEVVSYNASLHSVTLRETSSGDTRVISFNKLGSVDVQ